MKKEVLYKILSDTNEDKLSQKHNLVVDSIDQDKYENIRTEYSTAYQVGNMKVGRLTHSVAIFATVK